MTRLVTSFQSYGKSAFRSGRSLWVTLTFLLLTCGVTSFASEKQSQQDRVCDHNDDICLFHLLDRVTWGASPDDWEKLRSVGADAYLREQLSDPKGAGLAPKAKEEASKFDMSGLGSIEQARNQYLEGRRISKITDAESRQSQSRDNRKLADAATDATTNYFIIRSIYSDQQIRERMTWFWANHFSVDAAKGNAGFMLPNYLAMIRSHALGNFRDLLRGVVKSPSMLVYLDNTRNRKGKINENLARELLELHTLGASGGYSQTDVTNVAHVLTGLGITYDQDPPSLPSSQAAFYVQEGLFQFNPRFHDETAVRVLNKSIGGKGTDAVDALVDLLAVHPSTAKFIGRKLLIYFVQDEPTPADIEKIAQVFTKANGDIALTLSAVFDLPSFRASLDTPRFKDPIAYVFSTIRRTQPLDGSPVESVELARHLMKLGSRPFRRVTPDGYPMQSDRWIGSGQLLERVSIARRIAYSKSVREQNSLQMSTEPKCLSAEAGFNKTVVRTLREETRKAVMNAPDRDMCNFLLYSSPDFMMH